MEESNNKGDHSPIDGQFTWPPLPDITPDDPKAEVKKLLYQAQVDVIKAEKQVDLEIHKGQMAADVERERAILANEYAMVQAVHNAYLEVAKKEVERRIARSEFIQKVAAAVGSIYVAILALSFTVGKDGNRPLPAQGIIPTFFLGMSVVFTTVYLAYLENLDSPHEESYGGRFRESQRLRRNAFIKWAIEPSLRRLYSLHVSIFSLAFGVIFLPAPYLAIKENLMWIFAGIALVATFLIPELIRRLRSRATVTIETA